MKPGAMRPIRDTIPVEEALNLLLRAARPIERTELVPLDGLDGRVLARDVVAGDDVPPFDRAAMDGYAVIAEDTFGTSRFDPKTLRPIDKVFTGQLPSRTVSTGECVEIATGAVMPEGANAVVMVEETERAPNGDIRVLTPVYPGQNIGKRGGDIRKGQIVLRGGSVVTPGMLGAIAAMGLAEADAYARPRVNLLSTGNEIVEPGSPLEAGEIYDINRFTLSAIVKRHGGVPNVLPIAPDTLEDLEQALDGALDGDLIVFSGGSSVGERDLILDLIGRRGQIVFHGIAVKPGKPTAFGHIRETPVIGMPGYPTSCLSNAYVLLIPFLRRIARLPDYVPRVVTATAARRIVSTTGRHQFYPVRLVDGVAEPAFKASGDITSMADAVGYIEIPAQTDIVEAGQVVEVKLF
jgi:molybdenum cofactor synthesis domain-containing protein